MRQVDRVASTAELALEQRRGLIVDEVGQAHHLGGKPGRQATSHLRGGHRDDREGQRGGIAGQQRSTSRQELAATNRLLDAVMDGRGENDGQHEHPDVPQVPVIAAQHAPREDVQRPMHQVQRIGDAAKISKRLPLQHPGCHRGAGVVREQDGAGAKDRHQGEIAGEPVVGPIEERAARDERQPGEAERLLGVARDGQICHGTRGEGTGEQLPGTRGQQVEHRFGLALTKATFRPNDTMNSTASPANQRLGTKRCSRSRTSG